MSSLAMGVPTLVIGWSHKYREVLDMVGLAGWAMAHDTYSDAAFRERFAALVEASEPVRSALAGRLPGVRSTALEQVDVILDVARTGRARRDV